MDGWLYVRPCPLKLLEEKVNASIHRHGQGLPNRTPVTWETMSTIEKWDPIKPKSFTQ